MVGVGCLRLVFAGDSPWRERLAENHVAPSVLERRRWAQLLPLILRIYGEGAQWPKGDPSSRSRLLTVALVGAGLPIARRTAMRAAGGSVVHRCHARGSPE